ncbi:uncharacterized protein [Hetaerina americana]|uniref:uncharacterized protein n=1 Tax=Hetaerina americana TaxID=62018 RepID=UPI003A7F2690
MRVRWPVLAFGLALALSVAIASPAAPRDVRAAALAVSNPPSGAVLLSAIPHEDVFGPELATRTARDKRKLGWILDFVFWKFNKLLELKTRLLTAASGGSRPRSRPAPSSAMGTSGGSTTESSGVEFEGNRVSLVLPDELFGSAFTVVTDVSKIIGSVILNSARRTKTFIDALKPIFRRALGIQESTSAVLEDRLPNQLVIPSVADSTQEPDEPPLTMDSLSTEELERNSEETNDA